MRGRIWFYALLSILPGLSQQALSQVPPSNDAWSGRMAECSISPLTAAAQKRVVDFATLAVLGKIKRSETCLASAAVAVSATYSEAAAVELFRELLHRYPDNDDNWSDAFATLITRDLKELDALAQGDLSFPIMASRAIGRATSRNARAHAAYCRWLVHLENDQLLREHCWPGKWITILYPQTEGCRHISGKLTRAMRGSIDMQELAASILFSSSCGEDTVTRFHDALIAAGLSKKTVLWIRDHAIAAGSLDSWLARYPQEAVYIAWTSGDCAEVVRIAVQSTELICEPARGWMSCEKAAVCASRLGRRMLSRELMRFPRDSRNSPDLIEIPRHIVRFRDENALRDRIALRWFSISAHLFSQLALL